MHEGLKGKVEFQGRLTAKNKGGEIACADGILSVEKADEAIIYVSIATNFNNYQDITGNQIERAKNYLAKAMVCLLYTSPLFMEDGVWGHVQEHLSAS